MSLMIAKADTCLGKPAAGIKPGHHNKFNNAGPHHESCHTPTTRKEPGATESRMMQAVTPTNTMMNCLLTTQALHSWAESQMIAGRTRDIPETFWLTASLSSSSKPRICTTTNLLINQGSMT